MQTGNERGFALASPLVHPAAICLWFLFCVSSAFAGQAELSVFFGFIFSLTICSYIWGRLSLNGLEYSVRMPKSGVFPGQDVEIIHALHNGKLMPLVWAELLEPCDPAGCIAPDERFIVKNPEAESEQTDDIWRCLYTFSLFKWRQTLSFTDIWTARRRGLHRVEAVLLRSGDGFGLCVRSKRFKLDFPRTLAVYPRMVGVSVDMVLQDMWDTRSSSGGYLEDITLLRSVRDYLPQDPARRINQRLLARGQGIKINQYEVVTPNAVLFIMDTHSFDGKEEELETVLSILASLLAGLVRRGVQAGLAASASAYFPETCIAPSTDEAELTRMMELLAAADTKRPIRNSLPIAAPELIGVAYYIAYSADSASSMRLLEPFPPNKTRMLAYEAQPADLYGREVSVRSIREFKRVS